MTWRSVAVFLGIAVITGCYYDWGVRATGYDFEWHRTDLGGYYNLLTRGFTEGHLYMPVEPDPKLLAMPNPLDPNIGDDIPKLFDAVLFNRHYYLYHGVGPAVMLFLPWRSVTGHDLPESFALFLFCFGGFLFTALTLISMLQMTDVSPPAWLLALMLIALGFCQSIPFLLNRVWVYEVAIGAGYFCIAAGLFFLTRTLQSTRAVWPAAAGLMFGMAVACRPHLIVVAGFALIAALFALRRRALAFVIPLLIVGALIGDYNYLRFGSPLDFGLNYQITGAYQGRLRPRLANVLPGLYYMLFAHPEFTKVFPWVLMPFPPRSVPRPPEYFVEPIIGALFLAPFLPLALVALAMRKLSAIRWVTVLSACAILLFLLTTGLSTQRYEVDFLPWFVLASMAAFAVTIAKTSGPSRFILSSLLVVSVVFGVVVNLAMSITGPYDDMMKNKPARYVALAKWFSPVAANRPQLNPPVSLDFKASVRNNVEHLREDLLLIGRPPLQYELFLDHLNGKPVLVSRLSGVTMSKEIEPINSPLAFHVEYLPAIREMVVAANGTELMRQKLQNIVTAPTQIVPAGSRD